MNTARPSGLPAERLQSSRRRAKPTRWTIRPDPDPRTVVTLSQALRLSPAFARLLAQRGFGEPALAEAFLERRLDQLHDPAGLPDIQKAVDRIEAAVARKEKIVLFGDYDVDGVSATALLQAFFEVLRYPVQAQLPEREQGGYGLSPQAVARLAAAKPGLVIALDNGISGHAGILALQSAGAQTIVVDHHHPTSGELPAAVAVINPKRSDNSYPYTELCGAGLAFKLAWALAVRFSKSTRVSPPLRKFLLDALALAALGTLADVVPLTGENRILAAQGLRALRASPLPGLRALLEVCQLKEPPTASDVSFRIAPRINAAGRCGKAAAALELLTTTDPQQAAALAATLDRLNLERQKIEERIVREARQQALQALGQTPAPHALVLHSQTWHKGVIGIVASRMVEEFHRPTLLLSIDPATQAASGSGRSIHGFHLAEALAAGSELLTSYGGHAAAAGLSLPSARLEEFRARFLDHASRQLSPADLEPSLFIDEVIPFADLSAEYCSDLERLEPCGAANPRPTLASREVRIAGQIRPMGADNQHLSFFARSGEHALRAVGFGMGQELNALAQAAAAGTLELAFLPGLNTFRGQTTVELRLKAFRSSAQP